MSFHIRGLDPAPFAALHGLDDEALRRAGARRVRVAEKPWAPCRVTLADAEIGETVLLLSYQHQDADTPYRQQGPIFVREIEAAPFDATDEIPPALRVRLLSLRGYDEEGMMVAAEVVKGAEAEAAIARMFADPCVAVIHAHYASRGCFAARIERA
jgi:Protein of unknown function (DUF1203)